MQSKKCITSTGLKTTGSLNGFLGSGDQCCLSVTRYKKRSAEVAVLMLEAESLRDIVRFFLRVIAQSLQSNSPGVPLWDDCDAQMDDGVHIEPDWDLAAQSARVIPAD